MNDKHDCRLRQVDIPFLRWLVRDREHSCLRCFNTLLEQDECCIIVEKAIAFPAERDFRIFSLECDMNVPERLWNKALYLCVAFYDKA